MILQQSHTALSVYLLSISKHFQEQGPSALQYKKGIIGINHSSERGIVRESMNKKPQFTTNIKLS